MINVSQQLKEEAKSVMCYFRPFNFHKSLDQGCSPTCQRPFEQYSVLDTSHYIAWIGNLKIAINPVNWKIVEYFEAPEANLVVLSLHVFNTVFKTWQLIPA